MSFAVVLEGMTLITYIVILAGGKQKRESGWKILCGLHVLCGALQLAGMAIIVSLHSNRKKVEEGGRLMRGSSIGIPLRQRRSLLPRLEARYIMDRLHHQLEYHISASGWYRCGRNMDAAGRRLRINTRRQLGRRRNDGLNLHAR